MKGRFLLALAIAVLAVFANSAIPVMAGNVFAGVPSTVNGFPTWDSDIINVRDLLGEDTGYTGKGVYIAVLDTGLTSNWRDYFPEERIATDLGIGFYESVKVDDTCENIIRTDGVLHTGSFIGSTGSTHGTHVTSTIIGYFYEAPQDTNPNIPPIIVRGIAPEATIIPVKVLDTYHFPCGTGPEGVTFGTDPMVAAGIRYAADLPKRPMIVTMSLGGPEPTAIIEDAIDYAISKGVIVVAAAGNSGTEGMDWPGAYPQVISVGASGWKYEWYWPKLTPPSGPSGSQRYRLWWLQQNTWFPGGYSSGYNDIPNPTPAKQVYITDFSGRQLKSTPFTNCGSTHDQPCVQDLDVVAPGSWVRGPFPGLPGYAHLPWWSEGIGGLVGLNPGNFYYVGGTSMATPHVASVIALMLEKNPSLTQGAVESILESTSLKISAGSMVVFDLVPTPGFYTYSWGKDATGRGLVQADKALAAVP